MVLATRIRPAPIIHRKRRPRPSPGGPDGRVVRPWRAPIRPCARKRSGRRHHRHRRGREERPGRLHAGHQPGFAARLRAGHPPAAPPRPGGGLHASRDAGEHAALTFDNHPVTFPNLGRPSGRGAAGGVRHGSSGVGFSGHLLGEVLAKGAPGSRDPMADAIESLIDPLTTNVCGRWWGRPWSGCRRCRTCRPSRSRGRPD